METVETIILGAGVVGLALARKLAQDGQEVLILESEDTCGSVTSSRNSGVIHAGIYYKPGSLKARLCVEGRKKLYAYAASRGIPHKQCGKLIVATDETQIPQLQAWQTNAEFNGVRDLRLLSALEAGAMENEVFCRAALYVPDTGIIDAPSYLLSLEADSEAAGAIIALRTRATGGRYDDRGFVIKTRGDIPAEIGCKNLINAAGLGAQEFSRHLQGLDTSFIPAQVLAKGNYFTVSGHQPFKMLIYPLPTLGSSGLHACSDLAGRIRFGPDVEWVDHIDYTVDVARASKAEEAIRLYWPALPKGSLQPDYCGIRPKLARSSPHDSDFVIQDKHTHKIPNYIALYGIESPGLTSSLALADYVAQLMANELAG